MFFSNSKKVASLFGKYGKKCEELPFYILKEIHFLYFFRQWNFITYNILKRLTRTSVSIFLNVLCNHFEIYLKCVHEFWNTVEHYKVGWFKQHFWLQRQQVFLKENQSSKQNLKRTIMCTIQNIVQLLHFF